jgi:Insertion element 4 transposase N-terminal/Transposase DDE domain
MGGGWSSTRGRVLAGVGAGVLTRWITPALADEVLAVAGVAGGRPCQLRFRALPGRLGVYFVLGLCLFSDLPYRAVLKELTGGLGRPLRAAGWQVPASTALTRLRRRLGERPFELLFWQLCGALSPGVSSWSHICGLLAVAWDATTVKVPASTANIAAFGEVRGRKRGHYPQARLVTLIACGTRALLGAAIGPWRGTGERALAAGLLGQLRAGMLLLADRGFYSFRLWAAASGTGAALLWRVRASMHLAVVTVLPDGSWLAHINDPTAVAARARRNGQRRRRGSKLGRDTGPLPGITVRVIEFWLTVTTADGAARTERYRLITTLTDWRTAPAPDLAAGYAWRWAIETGFKEFKTYLRGAGRLLRGHTPELARQELWAYLTIYQAIRAVICLAAASTGQDPDQLSFTAALHATRRTLILARTSPAAALADTEADILTELIPRRQARICPRAVTRPSSPYRSRGNHNGPISQHARCSITIRPPSQPTHTHPDQATHHGNPNNQPP